MEFKRYFAWNYKLKHPAYILNQKNNNYLYLSITHAPYNKYGTVNIPLTATDDKDRQLFLVPIVCVDDKRHFSKGKLTWLKFDKADGHIIKNINEIVKALYNIKLSGGKVI